jgi:hypothetical protein
LKLLSQKVKNEGKNRKWQDVWIAEMNEKMNYRMGLNAAISLDEYNKKKQLSERVHHCVLLVVLRNVKRERIVTRRA